MPFAQNLLKHIQNKKCQHPKTREKASNSTWHVQRFSKEHVNLLLFKDSTVKRNLILDSRCMKELTLEDVLCARCQKMKCGYRRLATTRSKCPTCHKLLAEARCKNKYMNVCGSAKNDTDLVAEMIFGTAPLACTGTTLKVHSVTNPHRLMLTCVFPFAGEREISHGCDFDMMSMDEFICSVYNPQGMARQGSDSNLSRLATSQSMNIYDSTGPNSHYDSNSSLSNSVSSTTYTPQPSPSSSVTDINSSSKLSMMRRLRNSNKWRLENPGLGSSRPSSQDDSSLYSASNSECSTPPARRRQIKIGMSIVFSLDEFEDIRNEFENFFFSHITLIEGQLVRLRAAIEKGACQQQPQARVEIIMEALDVFRQNIYDLYTAQRVPNPVWLNMMASPSLRDKICTKFINEFTKLVMRYDTESTNFFVSTLLTGVLMHHLSWIPTVTPSGETQSAYSDKHSAKWLAMLAKSHPYNPLWAQLSDIYGAIGIPPRLARTIVIGNKTDLVSNFLFVLTYFIRCSEIHESLDECYDEEYLLSQIDSAVTDICLVSMERDASESFILVDAPSTGNELRSDSGHVSQSTVERDLVDSQNDSTFPSLYTQIQFRSESGIAGSSAAEPGASSDTLTTDSSQNYVNIVPSSSPADKVRNWINTSHISPPSSLDIVPCHIPSASPNPSSSATIQKSLTEVTIVATSPADSGPPQCEEIAEPPYPERIEVVEPVRRMAPQPTVVDTNTNSWDSASGGQKSFTSNLRRMFSSEIDEFDEYYYTADKATALERQASQISHPSLFDEYFEDDDNLDSCSGVARHASNTTPVPEPSTPTKRAALFKVPKASGYQRQTSTISQDETSGKQTVSRCASNCSHAADERCRKLSFSKHSSRCSTPQTIKCCAATSTHDLRHLQSCTTIPSEDSASVATMDPYSGFKDLNLPRSKSVDRNAETSISSTSFGRKQLGGFSDHYLTDFVLHGTSDQQVFHKVQADLQASVKHCILQESITEAVAVVADTERWSVHIASSMREQPKTLAPSQLVRSMVEAVCQLAKLNMAPEFVLMHMEDRLQEMLFKSRMVAAYITSQKKVDMDELNAMFGLEASDIKFLLAIAATHSTLNVQGIY